jgi:hypothetical protein
MKDTPSLQAMCKMQDLVTVVEVQFEEDKDMAGV